MVNGVNFLTTGYRRQWTNSRGCSLYSKKCCFLGKTTLFIYFGPLLLEALWEGVRWHHEAVGKDGGAHGDDMHVHQTPTLKAGRLYQLVWQNWTLTLIGHVLNLWWHFLLSEPQGIIHCHILVKHRLTWSVGGGDDIIRALYLFSTTALNKIFNNPYC
jgi:hypothetical protein